jgi:hypothetical protein
MLQTRSTGRYFDNVEEQFQLPLLGKMLQRQLVSVVWKIAQPVMELLQQIGYTYTIDYSGGLIAPSNGSSVVSCPANATNQNTGRYFRCLWKNGFNLLGRYYNANL